MRSVLRTWLVGVACAVSMVLVGCGKPSTCNVSPVEIEELREDVAVVQKNLATARERSDNLAKELATKQADLDSKKGKPDELRARLEAMRKGSGRNEKAKSLDTKTAPKAATPTTPKPATTTAPKPAATTPPKPAAPTPAKPDSTKKE